MPREHPFDDDLLENLPLPTPSFFVLFALAEERSTAIDHAGCA